MSGIEVNACEGQVGQTQGVHRGRGLNGVTLVEEGVEGAADAVVVELVGGDVPEELGAGFVRPLGDVDQCGGLGDPGRQEKAEHLAVRILQLGVGRQMAIDDVGES